MANAGTATMPTISIRSRFVQMLILTAVIFNLGLALYLWRPSVSDVPPSVMDLENPMEQEHPQENPEEVVATQPVTSKKVAIMNAVGTHDEVVVSVLYTMLQIPEYEVDLFFSTPRYGIEQIIAPFYSKPLMQPFFFNYHYQQNSDPDLVILASCDASDLVVAGDALLSMAQRKPDLKIMCIVHNPQSIQDLHQQLLPFAQRGVLYMVGLSPHVVDYIKQTRLPQMAQDLDAVFASLPTFLFVPTFDYRLPQSCAISGDKEENLACINTFVVQGLFESGRRDYSSLFDHLQSKISDDQDDWNNFHLLLLGQGSPFDLQEPLASHVSTYNDIPYLEYYDKIHHSLALLPAFASDSYLVYKASSSIGASLLTGVPMIADQQLLDAYTHLTRDGVYFQNDGEHYVDTVERIRKLSIAEVNEKRANASAMNQRIIQDNVNRFKNLKL